ncbi:excinuclease ABC subunit UvrA [Bacteroidota bacterium]
MPVNIDQLDPKHYIVIKGARVNNLKNLDVAIPRNKLVVITGVSGSGKSSLAFDTLFAEGQRMYVESLSSYARQFLGRMEKPEVDYIKGVAPAIAIEQKANTRNPRSTVGTTTEIYDYLKLLFARIGKTYSPVSGERVKRDSITDIVDYIHRFEEEKKVQILCPLSTHKNRSIEIELNILLSKGFSRIRINSEIHFIQDLLESKDYPQNGYEIQILIDRAVIKHEDEDNQFRLSDSVQTAFYEGNDECIIAIDGTREKRFSDRFEKDGLVFEEPSANLFSFNNPYGACKTCEGFGKILGIDEDLVMPDKSLSVFEGAIVPWRSETMKEWQIPLLMNADRFNFPVHRPIFQLAREEYELLWTGNNYFKGLNAFFKHIESKTHKIQYRVLLSRYRGRTVCPDCRGTRLRKDAAYVLIHKKSITDLVLLPVYKVLGFFNNLKISAHDQDIAQRLISEIKFRLEYLCKVGLEYLTLNRLTNSLSGGEFQRIKLATSLGSALVGSMYILDEPSIGLHPRDTKRLISVLEHLRNLGNTVIVVEHEEEVMQAADELIDIGPDAGSHGGELVYQGSLDNIHQNTDTHTARYLNGIEKIVIPERRRSWKKSIIVRGARENNLKNIDVEIPLGCLTVICGVSGSGKSTLVKNILFPALSKILGIVADTTGKFDRLDGDYQSLKQIEFVDQNPIGKSSRSNPVTYVKAYDIIRKIFADQSLSQHRGYKPAHFSFNVDGGRCESCQGEGTIKIEMQFMADIYLQCESCHGKRFKQEVLEIRYKNKNISDILEMTIDDSVEFFSEERTLISRLKPLQDVGLGYIRLGQSSSTLSGGEAQRVKLASFLGKGRQENQRNILFIFDEPTTGLHFHDINKLLKSINALVEQGNSAVIIEHNLEIIKSADWIIDLGPEGGDENGGNIVFEGTPEDLVHQGKGHTAQFLKNKLNGN